MSPSTSASPATFVPKDVTPTTFRVGLQSGFVGLIVSSIQNSLSRHDKGAMGVFTRTGGTISLFAAMGAAFTATDATAANLREKDDAINGALGGCAAGFIAGLKQRSIPAAFGACGIIGASSFTFDAAGRSISGDKRQQLNREEREDARQSSFKNRSSLESVNTAPLEKAGIDVDSA